MSAIIIYIGDDPIIQEPILDQLALLYESAQAGDKDVIDGLVIASSKVDHALAFIRCAPLEKLLADIAEMKKVSTFKVGLLGFDVDKLDPEIVKELRKEIFKQQGTPVTYAAVTEHKVRRNGVMEEVKGAFEGVIYHAQSFNFDPSSVIVSSDPSAA